jgi:threonine/homoserine/homoserine lactone efflux protein
MGIILIVLGCIAIAIGICGGEFYSGDPDAISSFNRKILERRGRIVAILAGLLLIAGGVKILVLGQ